MQNPGSTWTLVGGTGKLKGAKGSSSCKGTATPDSGATYECERAYQLPTSGVARKLFRLRKTDSAI